MTEPIRHADGSTTIGGRRVMSADLTPGSTPIVGDQVAMVGSHGNVRAVPQGFTGRPWIGRQGRCKANGDTCKAYVVKGTDYCYGHSRSRNNNNPSPEED